MHDPIRFAPLLLKPPCKFFQRANVEACQRRKPRLWLQVLSRSSWGRVEGREGGSDVCSCVILGGRREALGADFGQQPTGVRGARRMLYQALISLS